MLKKLCLRRYRTVAQKVIIPKGINKGPIHDSRLNMKEGGGGAENVENGGLL